MKRMLIAAVLAFGLAMGTAATAQAQTYLSDWLVPDMKRVMTDAGVKVTGEGSTSEGLPYVSAETANGLKFTIYGAACDVGPTKRCRGAEFVATFTMDSDAAVQTKIDSLNYAAVAIGKGGSKKLAVSRYIIFDYGIHRDNLKLNLTVFTTVAEEIWDKI